MAFVQEGAEAMGCDPALIALPVLSVVASAIGNSRTLQIKRGWEAPSVIWTATVAESGSLKSPAIKLAVAPLYRIQAKLREDFLRRSATYETELAEWKAKAKEDGEEAAGSKPEKPIFRRVITSDTTIEKLADISEDNPRGILTARDELAGWFGSFCRYKSGKGGTDLPYWLEAHCAGTWLVDRKTGAKQHYFVPRAAISVCGGIQPGILARVLTQDNFDAGLPARLLMAMPPSRCKQWSEAEVSPETMDAYERCLNDLLALPMVEERNERRPYVLHMNAEAKRAWRAHYADWAQRQDGADSEVAAALSKLEEAAARLAALAHLEQRYSRKDKP
jgi:hypothetical protein